MRPEASHLEPHRAWIPAFASSPRTRRNDCLGPIALPKSATFAEAVCRRVVSRSRLRNRCGGQQPFLLVARRGGGGRNARATSRAHAHAGCVPGNSLSRITGCRWLCRNHPAKSGTSRFAEPTLRHFVAPRNTKNFPRCAETVDDDTSLWKREEKPERTLDGARRTLQFQ